MSNLLLSGNSFTQSVWTTNGANTFTDNAVVAPDSSMTATLFVHAAGNNGDINQTLSTLAAGEYTMSFYLRSDTPSTNAHMSANGTTSGYFTATSVWARFSFTFTADSSFATDPIFHFYIDLNSGPVNIWGAQLVAGAVPVPYVVTNSLTILPLNGTTLGYRIGTGDRPIGSTTGAPDGFAFLSLTDGKVYIAMGGVWTDGGTMPSPTTAFNFPQLLATWFGTDTANYTANPNSSGFRIGSSDRVLGSATTSPEGFAVLNQSTGNTFVSAGGVWTAGGSFPSDLLAAWLAS